MFHVELRQFPHTARAFNLTRERIRGQILIPWLRGDIVQLDSQQFAPERAKLKIYEGPELQTADMGMGRGWQNVTRRGEDVTERELNAAKTAPPAPVQPRSELLFHHVDLAVSDLDRSVEFYSELLKLLGFDRQGGITGERGERVVYLGRTGTTGALGLRERTSDTEANEYDRYTLGLHHLAFDAQSRAIVDQCARWLAERGATIESGPQEYDYMPGYYAVFFYDPDGIKLEVVHS